MVKIFSFYFIINVFAMLNLSGQISSIPKDTVYIENHDKLGLTLISDYKADNKFSLRQMRKVFKETLIETIILNNDSLVILSRKSRFLSTGDAGLTNHFNRIKIRDNKIVNYRFQWFCPFGRVIEMDTNGKVINKKLLSKNKVFQEFMQYKLSRNTVTESHHAVGVECE